VTERWRKRLEHLDKESPSDEVFDRAHQGPRLPDAPVGMPSTSTRVVTAIAAFAVFALAISVFAIPVLRLRDQPGDAGQPLLPLWPVRTLDDVEGAQVWLDGGAHPGEDLSMFKVPETLLDPEGVARNFGKQVMGWDDPSVLELDGGWGAGVYAEPSTVTSGPIAYGDRLCKPPSPVDGTLVECDGGYATPVPAEWSDNTVSPGPMSTGPTSSPAASPFRKIAVYEFDPGLVPISWLQQAGVILTLFQPLGMAEGNIWTVLDVEGSSLGMPLAAGSTVVAGEVIELSNGWGEPVTAGVHIGASENCDVTTNDVEVRQQTIRLRVTVPEGSSCRGTVPGYVYAAVQLAAPLEPDADPIANGSGEGLHALSAVPVMVRIPEAPSSVSPTPEPDATPTPDDPTDEPSGPTMYADPLGWSIEVPAGWSSQDFDEFNGRYTVSGAWFSSGDVDVLPGVAELPEQPVPADGEVMVKIWNRQGGPLDLPQDSSFVPFISEALDRVAAGEPVEGTFTADGLTYSFSVQHGEGAPTQEQTDALAGMVASMSFEPWEPGEVRDAFMSIGVGDSGAPEGTVVQAGDRFYILRHEQQVMGPIPTCGGLRVFLDTSLPANDERWTVSCEGEVVARFNDFGYPDEDNSPPYAGQLIIDQVITSWDGRHLLLSVS